ncbi:MAG TPA: hypothetical protein VGI04_01830 [Neobacillus sp.]
MSLTKVKMLDVIKKQYVYKLKAYIQVFMTLVILQLLAILFSFNGVGGSGGGSSTINFERHYYSADIVVSFTLLWGFITAVLITTKAYRNDDFVFVTNRVSNNLANMFFALTASIIGAITAMLSTYLIKVIMYFFAGNTFVKSINEIAGPSEFLLGIFATTLYIFLFSALGYFVGTLVQINKLFVVVLPALLFGSIFLLEGRGNPGIVQTTYEFIFTESSMPLFIVKIIVSAGLLFSAAFVISNRMEVKQ